MKWRLPVYRRHRLQNGISPAIRMVVLMSMFAISMIIMFNFFGQDIAEKLLTPIPSLIIVLGALLFIILDNKNKRK